MDRVHQRPGALEYMCGARDTKLSRTYNVHSNAGALDWVADPSHCYRPMGHLPPVLHADSTSTSLSIPKRQDINRANAYYCG